jgi:hypothetical protein
VGDGEGDGEGVGVTTGGAHSFRMSFMLSA